MKKYEIRTDTYELTSKLPFETLTGDEIFREYIESGGDFDPVIEGSYDTLEEARAAFAAYADYGSSRQERYHKSYLLRGRLAWIEENDYDEDGDWVSGGDTYDVSAQSYINDEITYDYKRHWLSLYKGGKLIDTLTLDGDTLDDYTPDPKLCPTDDPYETLNEAMEAVRGDYADRLYEKFCGDPVILLTKEEADECGGLVSRYAYYVVCDMWER